MLGDAFHHLSCILVEHRIMLDDQEAVAVLIQDGHELEGGEGPADLQLGDVAIQPAENAGVVARDVEGPVALQIDVAVQGTDQHLYRGDQDIECLFQQGDCRMEFDFHG